MAFKMDYLAHRGVPDGLPGPPRHTRLTTWPTMAYRMDYLAYQMDYLAHRGVPTTRSIKPVEREYTKGGPTIHTVDPRCCGSKPVTLWSKFRLRCGRSTVL